MSTSEGKDPEVRFPEVIFKKVPAAMQAARRWILWEDVDGKKPPRGWDGRPLEGWKDPATWLTWHEAGGAYIGHAYGWFAPGPRGWPELPPSNRNIGGLGFVLGDQFGGLDLDGCRDPKTGAIDPSAQAVIDRCDGAYVEVSPSGKGVKIFGLAPVGDTAWMELTFEKDGRVRVEPRSAGFYFTVTGAVLREGAAELPVLPFDLVALAFGQRASRREKRGPLPAVVLPGRQNVTLFAEGCALRRRGYEAPQIAAALWSLVAEGRVPAEPGAAPWTRAEVDQMAARMVDRYPAGNNDFVRSKEGAVIPTVVDNIRKAVRALGARPRRDRFSEETVIFWEDDRGRRTFDGEELRHLFFTIGSAFGFSPPDGLIAKVVEREADLDDFHPVLDYLHAVEWDGVERIGTWLSRYLAAEDTPYTRAVGQLVLVGAVRRVRNPGSKFDELLVLESPQGLDKSNALRALCPNAEWFSESLPLGVDSKVTIERTLGIWIIEAAEMVSNGKDVDRLKAFLSTQVDGPARMAYAPRPIRRPRHFVVIGTTNHSEYLLDATGNRRFWPVRVGGVKLDALKDDRDQLWAEAAHVEKIGAPTRLDPSLWEAASRQQEARRVVDPWEEFLAERLGEGPGKLIGSSLWDLLAVPKDRRTQEYNARLGAVMRRLGFTRTNVRHGERVWKGYTRGPEGVPGGSRPWLIEPGDPFGKPADREPGEEG